MIDNARDFLDSILDYGDSGTAPPSSADRPIRLGTIDPAYSWGLAQVLFDGETLMGLKGYAWNASAGWDPSPGERVFLVPVGTSYLIGGPVKTSPTFLRPITLTPLGVWGVYDVVTSPPAPDNLAPDLYGSIQATKSADGWVVLSGLLGKSTSSLAAAAGSTVFILPVGLRPAVRLRFPAYASYGSNGVVGLDVLPTGAVVLTTAAPSTNHWISPSNIQFNVNVSWSPMALVSPWVVFGTTATYGVPSYGVDSYGVVTAQGLISGGSVGVNAWTRPSNQSFTTSAWEYHLIGISASVPSTFAYINATAAGGTPAYATRPRIVNTHSLASLRIPTTLGTPLVWNAFTIFFNSWINYNVPAFPIAAWANRPDGLVMLQGLVRAGTVSTPIVYLPVGSRPSKHLIFMGVSNDVAYRLDIYPDGRIVAGTGASSTWVSLDGIMFAPAA